MSGKEPVAGVPWTTKVSIDSAAAVDVVNATTSEVATIRATVAHSTLLTQQTVATVVTSKSIKLAI